MKTAFIFPAFVSEFIGTEIEILHRFSGDFQQKLSLATRITGDNYLGFSLTDSRFTGDELRSQIISYLFGASLADELISRGLKPDAVAGYSMGLYAALYGSGVYHFEDGIRLIEKAFAVSRAAIEKTGCGMGSVIGLTKEEIENIIARAGLETTIANVNSEHSHLVTGRKADINRLLDEARKIGALNVSFLPVETPYHSHFLKKTQDEFNRFIREQIPLKEPHYPVISSIDQKTIKTTEDVVSEITRNLYESLNWENTFKKLLDRGITRFVECGAGKSLQKISRFMPGDFKVYPMNKIDKLIF